MKISSKILFGSKTLTEPQQGLVFSRRAMLLGAAQFGVGALLVGRMGYIAIAENEKYTLLSESNRVNLTLIPPRRGWIVDRNGLPLANNRTDFRVDIIPERLRNNDRVIGLLAELLALQPEDVDRIREEIEKGPGFQPVQVADGLNYEQYAAVSVRLTDLPGVTPSQGFSRHYPAGATVGHLIGYVGAASAEEYKQSKDPLLIAPGFKVGKQGLEKSFDARLTGKPGARRVEVTARGRIVRDLDTRPDTPGGTLRLTVDAGLQEYAGRRLATQSGAVIVLDCQTGDVLTMASMPSFDPNSFSDGIGHLEWNMLSADDHVPLRNKALQGLYPPGSTVKPMIALSFLEAGLPATEQVVCRGAIRLGNRLFHCHKRSGHGAVDMHRAIKYSCNVYFYTMAQRIGMPVIAEMSRRLGLGQKFPLPFPSQSYGTVPDPEWKKRKYDADWQVYDTVNATIGQGYMLVNPTQLAVMSARLASGKLLMPNVVADPRRQRPALLGVRPENIEIIRNAMGAVVNEGGTGGAARIPIPDVMMAGKTGTAQSRGIRDGRRNNASLPFRSRDHALFIGFAPYQNPRYAIGTIIEHGGHLNRIEDAPMISADVLSYLYDPAGAMERLEKYEAGWGGTPQQRYARQMDAYRIAQGVAPPPDNAANHAEAAANVSEAASAAGNRAEAAEPVAPEPPPSPAPDPDPEATAGPSE